MSKDWMSDHEEWLSQFNEVVNEALNVDPETPLEEPDELAMSDLAAKVMNGKITLGEAFRRVHEWIAGRHGIKWCRSEEEFRLEVGVLGLIDITAETKVNLLIAGEAGIADGIVQLFADPRILISGPGDVADLSNQPAVAMHSKGWFNCARFSDTENKNFTWAVETALKEVLSRG